MVDIVKEETLPFFVRKGLKSTNHIDNSIHIMTVNAACEDICKYTLKPTVSQMKEVSSKIFEVFPHTIQRLGSRHDGWYLSINHRTKYIRSQDSQRRRKCIGAGD
jgi:hypothetical protein